MRETNMRVIELHFTLLPSKNGWNMCAATPRKLTTACACQWILLLLKEVSKRDCMRTYLRTLPGECSVSSGVPLHATTGRS